MTCYFTGRIRIFCHNIKELLIGTIREDPKLASMGCNYLQVASL